MNHSFLFLLMVFLHITSDFGLQGHMGEMKQIKYWDDQLAANPQVAPPLYPNYRYDYIAVLVAHSLQWAFCIMLPIAYAYHWQVGDAFVCTLLFNALTHCIIDNAKANEHSINLVQDQLLHLLQIIATIYIFYPII